MDEKIQLILLWSESKTKFFDISFLENISTNNRFSPDQEKSINNIFYKFHIDKWIENKMNPLREKSKKMKKKL